MASCPLRETVDTICYHITDACDHYETSAPTVHQWLDDLYRRIESDWSQVSLSELRVAWDLHIDGQWAQPNMAANEVYHLMERLGRPTIGQAGF